jgi:hypothetical protein
VLSHVKNLLEASARQRGLGFRASAPRRRRRG